MDSTLQHNQCLVKLRLTSSYIKEEYGSWKYIYCFIPVSEGTIDRDTMRRMRDFSTFNISHELTACPLYHFSLIISGYNYYAVF